MTADIKCVKPPDEWESLAVLSVDAESGNRHLAWRHRPRPEPLHEQARSARLPPPPDPAWGRHTARLVRTQLDKIHKGRCGVAGLHAS
jgi:hypothetical protein